MIDDASLVALQRSLNEYREAKRKIRIRLAEIEAEAEMLRSQLAMQETMIEQSELMLRRMLLPADRAPLSPETYPTSGRFADPVARPEASAAEIDAEVAKIRQHEKKSNVRFNDFRIPQAATIVLREAQGPLHVSEIYRRMAEGGFEFRGQHHLITLAVSLSRSKRFRKVAPGTFELNPNDMSAHSEDENAEAYSRTNAANNPT